MFTWAVITPDNKVKSIQRATIDVLKTRPNEFWVRIPSGTKWQGNLIYNPVTESLENG